MPDSDAKRTVRYRRSRCLICYWEGGSLVVENFLTGTRTDVSPALLGPLDSVQLPASKEELVRNWSTIPGSRDLITRLLRADILIQHDGRLDRLEKEIDANWKWGIHARSFHYATQKVDFESGRDAQISFLLNQARIEPPPTPYKTYAAKRLDLSEGRTGIRRDFLDVLYQRRTHRQFAPEAIAGGQLGTILSLTWGQTGKTISSDIGENFLRTSPSGGARHPIEVYCIVRKVNGIPSGVYHFSVEHNALEHLRGPISSSQLDRLFCQQKWVSDAAAVFIMTGVLRRQMWKYYHSHAYRVLMLDAGHLGQTFHLVVTALGLAPFTCAAVRAWDIEAFLGLDHVTECFVYAGVVGVPVSDVH